MFGGTQSFQAQFHQAVQDGDVDRVRDLLAHEEVDPAANNSYAIWDAVRMGHLEVIMLLLADTRVDPAVSSNFPIQIAIDYGHVDAVIILLSDTRVDPADLKNLAISFALQKGHIEMVDALLTHPAVRRALPEDSWLLNRYQCNDWHHIIYGILADYGQSKRRQQDFYTLDSADSATVARNIIHHLPSEVVREILGYLPFSTPRIVGVFSEHMENEGGLSDAEIICQKMNDFLIISLYGAYINTKNFNECNSLLGASAEYLVAEEEKGSVILAEFRLDQEQICLFIEKCKIWLGEARFIADTKCSYQGNNFSSYQELIVALAGDPWKFFYTTLTALTEIRIKEVDPGPLIFRQKTNMRDEADNVLGPSEDSSDLDRKFHARMYTHNR